MKEICIITQCSLPIPTTKGGAVETLVEYLINENEKNKKYKFTVITVLDEKAKKLSKKYKYTDFIYIKPFSEKLTKIRLFIYKVLKKIQIYIPFSLEFREALKILKKMDEKDIYIYEAGPTTQLPLINKIIPKNKLLAHIHWDGLSNNRKDNSFKYLIPVSNYIADQWKINTKRQDDKIKVLKNCAKIELFSKKITEEEKNELKEKLNIPRDNYVIIFTGRIVEEKGIKELLMAYDELNTKNVTLLVIGSANFGAKTNTPYEKSISRMISQSRRSIIFTGFVHQTELYKYYNIADVAVMPSLFQDPAPLVCIETQATGTPLIATKVGGIPEYVTKDSAILIEKNDDLVKNMASKIDYLLNNKQIRVEMGEAGIENASQYCTANYYDKFSKILDEAIK